MTLKETYKKAIPKLKEELGLKNDLAVPKIEKVSINVGIGTYTKDNKDFKPVIENIAKITGQKPIVIKSRKAISNFNLRIGKPVGITCTLRRGRMEDFLTKLIHVVFPRMRDFRGIDKKSFDGKGNYCIGMKEFTVFPEIVPEDVVKMHGLEINIVTTAKNNEEGYKLLSALGFPFKKETT